VEVLAYVYNSKTGSLPYHHNRSPTLFQSCSTTIYNVLSVGKEAFLNFAAAKCAPLSSSYLFSACIILLLLLARLLCSSLVQGAEQG
jgi:hypothetical protein